MTLTILANACIRARRFVTATDAGADGGTAVGIFGRVERRLLRLYCQVAVPLTRDRSAVTALEYGLIAGLIAVVIIVTVTKLGTNLNATFNTIASHFTNGTVT